MKGRERDTEKSLHKCQQEGRVRLKPGNGTTLSSPTRVVGIWTPCPPAASWGARQQEAGLRGWAHLALLWDVGWHLNWDANTHRTCIMSRRFCWKQKPFRPADARMLQKQCVSKWVLTRTAMPFFYLQKMSLRTVKWINGNILNKQVLHLDSERHPWPCRNLTSLMGCLEEKEGDLGGQCTAYW